MARQYNNARPKNLRYTVGKLLDYMGRHKLLLLLVAVLVTVSALANLLGTYMIRPVVNDLVDGDLDALIRGVVLTACIYAVGALSALGYTQTMVKAAQKVLYDIRRDLFAHLQTLPLRFFDTRRHGDIMSYFTGDVDTISDALNNSFTMLIQSFIQMTGTLLILFILNWRLSLFVVLGYLAMFLYIRYSGRRSKAHYSHQQQYLGELNGYIEEMVSGQKVVKVFNHEEENLKKFRARNEALRAAGEGAQSYAATMVPAVVTISYINYAIVAVFGGLLALQGLGGRGQPGQLSGVRAPGVHAHQPVHRPVELPAGGAGRRGARLSGHEPASGGGRGQGAPRARGGWQGLGLAAGGRHAHAPARRCAL